LSKGHELELEKFGKKESRGGTSLRLQKKTHEWSRNNHTNRKEERYPYGLLKQKERCFGKKRKG